MSAVRELVQGERRGRWMVAAVACAAALAWSAAPARAATVGTIPGSPLTIYANDNGQLQVDVQRQLDRRVLPAAAAQRPTRGSTSRSRTASASAHRLRLPGSAFTPDSLPRRVTGDGSAGESVDPDARTIATDTPGSNIATVVDETLTYVNGTTDVGVQYTCRTMATIPAARCRELYEAADLYVAGDDTGVGFFASGPPPPGRRRSTQAAGEARGGSSSRPRGRTTRRVDTATCSPRSWAAAGDAGLQRHDRLRRSLDNGVGVQWNLRITSTRAPQTSSTRPGASAASRRSQLTARGGARSRARSRRSTVTARNSDGNPDPGRSVLYAIAGANPGGGA